MRLFILAVFTLFISLSFAQSNSEPDFKGWYLKDKKDDGFMGISLNKAYQFLKGKTSTPIIVAIIDSGIDTTHEDLKSVLWTNKKEIPGNGIDDDGNGYVDDVHGWNFLGNKDGTEAEKASSEKARVYHSFKDKFDNKTVDTTKLSKTELRQYKMWVRAAHDIEPAPETGQEITGLERMSKKIHDWDSIINLDAHISDYTANDLEKVTMTTDEGKKAKLSFLSLVKAIQLGNEAKKSFIVFSLNEELGKLKDELEEKDKAPIDIHATIIKDNYSDISDSHYGNTNIMGKASLHGTHVSGIIGAKRNNGIGIDGIADNVQIMMIRAVPDGDEYDKDIALSIRYAVDNGAKVINMSFGKSFSPQKQWVDDAIKYAATKDVLVVHAAGNDGKNIDSTENFPSTDFLDGSHATNVITVGASSDTAIINNYVAGFSNYGKLGVDVFAPGSQIYSSLPNGNNYGFLDGTSMATPVVVGLAALVRSYYPNLTALQTKAAIEESVTPINKNVFIPGTETEVKLSNICKSGGIINAYGAVVKADELSKSKTKKRKLSFNL